MVSFDSFLLMRSTDVFHIQQHCMLNQGATKNKPPAMLPARGAFNDGDMQVFIITLCGSVLSIFMYCSNTTFLFYTAEKRLDV